MTYNKPDQIGNFVQTYSVSGALVVAAGKSRFRAPFPITLSAVSAAIDTAPVGAAVIVDVNKNGTTVFTTQANRPSIAAGANSAAEVVPDVVSVAAGDVITVDVDQIGSTTAGSDLSVMVRYRRT